jgi:hypothetical protein
MKIRLLLAAIAGMLIMAGSPVPGQTQRTSAFMREKLTHAQRMLEALTTSDYALLDREARALTTIVESRQWDELRTPEFLGYTDAFLAANRRVLAASAGRDLDEAALAYQTLVASCYSCHRYRKANRLAPSRPFPGRPLTTRSEGERPMNRP